MLILILIIVYIFTGLLCFSVSKELDVWLRNNDVLVPLYDIDPRERNDSAGKGVYAGFWIFTVPFTALYYFTIKQAIDKLKALSITEGGMSAEDSHLLEEANTLSGLLYSSQQRHLTPLIDRFIILATKD